MVTGFKLLSLVLIFIPICSFSQFNSSFEINGGLLNAYHFLKSSDTSDIIKYILSDRKSTEFSKLNWKIGFNYNKRLTQHFILKSGLNLRSMGYKTKVYTDFTFPDPGTPEFTEVQLFYNYWFFDIPVIIRYELNMNNISPFIEFGAIPSIYFTNFTKQRTNIETKRNFYWHAVSVLNFKRLNFATNLNLGINFLLNVNYQAFIQTSLYCHASPLAASPIKEYQYGYGLEIGIRKKIQ